MTNLPLGISVFVVSSSLFSPPRPLRGGKPEQSIEISVQVQQGQQLKMLCGAAEVYAQFDDNELLVEPEAVSEGAPPPRTTFLLRWNRLKGVFEGKVPQHASYRFHIVVPSVPAGYADGVSETFVAQLDWRDQKPLPADRLESDGRAVIIVGTNSSKPIPLDLRVPAGRTAGFEHDHPKLWSDLLREDCKKPDDGSDRDHDPDRDRDDEGDGEREGDRDRDQNDDNDDRDKTEGDHDGVAIRVETVEVEQKSCMRPSSLALFAPMPMASMNGDFLRGGDLEGLSTNPGVGIGVRFSFVCRTWHFPEVEEARDRDTEAVPRDPGEKIRQGAEGARDAYETVRDNKSAEEFNQAVEDTIVVFVPKLKNDRPKFGSFLELGIYTVLNYEGHRSDDWRGQLDSGLALTLEIDPWARARATKPKARKSPIRDFRFAVGGRMWWDKIAESDGTLRDQWGGDPTRFGLLVGLSFGVELFDRDNYMCGVDPCSRAQRARFIAQTLYDNLVVPPREQAN